MKWNSRRKESHLLPILRICVMHVCVPRLFTHANNNIQSVIDRIFKYVLHGSMLHIDAIFVRCCAAELKAYTHWEVEHFCANTREIV